MHSFAKARLIILSIVLMFAACSDDDPSAPSNGGPVPQVQVHISYYDVTNGDLKYAVKNAGAWSLETVDATGDVGSHTSIAVDAQDNPLLHIIERNFLCFRGPFPCVRVLV